ncbi:MAG: non-homologous end-joining DNA ligase [Acidimicrobiia bacterium]
MLATSWPAPFSDDDWFFEPKWDGVRVILTHDGVRVSLRSRRGNDMTGRYSELIGVELEGPVVLDGEIVVLDEAGAPSFERLQQRSGRFSPAVAAAHPVSLVVFDVLHRGGRALVGEPLEARLQELAALDLVDPLARTDPVEAAGLELWQAVIERDLEGMVAKRRGSLYRPGVRSEDWRKIPNVLTARLVVGGFTPGEGGRGATFGALLVGLWDGDRLRWAGSVGTGFAGADLTAIRGALDQQLRADSPFHPDEGMPREAVWVEPSLVAAVGYRNWTSAGRLRHPRFRGFTDDPPDEITWEVEGPGS